MSRELVRQNGRGTTWNCNKKDSERELREQIQQEIETKSKFCSNPTFHCSLPRLDGYEFCLRHILRDARSNYRQCTHLYFNGRKCVNAVIKHDIKKDPNLTTLCFEHNRQTQLNKTHITVGKLKQIETNEILLSNLINHMNVEEVVKKERNCGEQDEEIDVVTPHVSTFVPHEHVHNLNDIVTAIRKRRRILDYASDSSTDDEPICMNNTSRAYECNQSDNESIESQDEDLLNHACIYTRQEAICISEAKLTKLQGLYIAQINRLHHLLREKRRSYLHAMRKEREQLCSIHDQVKRTPRENVLYKRLKALNSYHRRHGFEAVLYKQFKEKRSRAGDMYPPKVVGSTRCTYTEGGVKCGERTLPSSKFCRKHILEDKKQILFKACEVEKSGIKCREPVTCVFEKSTCILHLPIPTQRVYVKTKYESETEEEEAGKIVKNKKDNNKSKDIKYNKDIKDIKYSKNSSKTNNNNNNNKKRKKKKTSKNHRNNKTSKRSGNSKTNKKGENIKTNKNNKNTKDDKIAKVSKNSKIIKHVKDIKKEIKKEFNKDTTNKEIKKEIINEIKKENRNVKDGRETTKTSSNKDNRYNNLNKDLVERVRDVKETKTTKSLRETKYNKDAGKQREMQSQQLVVDEKIFPLIRNIKVEINDQLERENQLRISNQIKIEIKKENDDYTYNDDINTLTSQHFNNNTTFIHCKLKQEKFT